MQNKFLIYITVFVLCTIIELAGKIQYCSGCKNTIHNSVQEIDGYFFHLNCFTCANCESVITGEYQKYQSKYFHPVCYKKYAGLYCNYCGQLLGDHFAEYNSKLFHEQCYKEFIQPRCDVCSQPLPNKYITDQNGNYHHDCHRNHILPKCTICTLPLENSYLIDPWGNKYHKYHSQDGVLCSSCSRVISEKITQGGYKFNDGRFLCSLCEASIIKTDSDINKSKNRVTKQLSSIGIFPFPDSISISTVDNSSLKRKSRSLHHNNLKGVTNIKIQHKPLRMVSRRYEINILNGLLKTEFEAVLAHELIHIWLTELDKNYSDIFTEGFCNLGSALIYDNDNTKFSRIHLKSMIENDDPVYGEGYRMCRKLLSQHGWSEFITRVKNGNLPF